MRLVDHEQLIFRQERLGLHADPFTILKLRTMPDIHEQTDSNGIYNPGATFPDRQVGAVKPR